MKTQVVKFNIGGRKYEVARSLLESYPDSMLYKSASKVWLENPDEEVYIERDGNRFAYCLDYLRDKKCYLPFTVSKDAVMKDLKYYGIENVDERNIHIHHPEGKDVMELIHLSHQMIKKLTKNEEDREIEASDNALIKTQLNQFIVNGQFQIIFILSKVFRKCFNPITKERQSLYAKYGLKLKQEDSCLNLEWL